MSRKSKDTTAQMPGAYQPAREKPKTSKKAAKSVKQITGGGGGDEETPVTVSGGSIVVRTVFDREDLDGKKHKHCKIKDAAGKKWKPVRVEIDDDSGIRSFNILGENGSVRVIFSRPA